MKNLTALALLAVVSLASVARAESLARPASFEPSATLFSMPTLFEGVAEETPTARTTIFGLPQNVGTVDRIIRGVIAATLVGVGSYRAATDAPMPGWTAALFAIAAVPALTGATGSCPAYHLFGWDTNF